MVSDALSACYPSLQYDEGAPALSIAAHPHRPQVAFAPAPCGLPAVGLVFSLALGVCAPRPVPMVPASGRLPLLSLLAVFLLGCLVRVSASRCVWLPFPGLPLSALGSALLVRWLLLSLRPGSPWLLPLLVSLLVLSLSCPRPGAPVSLSLACCALLPRARVGPRRPPARWCVAALLVVPEFKGIELSRWRQ